MLRLSRPFFQLALAVAYDLRSKSSDPSTDRLVSLLPPGRPLETLRMRQYLMRLSVAWRDAFASQRIVIFDQGYIQAVSSILLASRRIDENSAAEALAVAPRSDLAFRILTPPAEIARRLSLRAQTHGFLGRLLESKADDPMIHAGLADRLQSELEQCGRPVIAVRSADDGTFAGEIARAELEVNRCRAKGV